MTTLTFRLHKLFNEQKRFTFPFKQRENEIPQNGIYIIFENGETFDNIDRIVRVGTHTGDKQLRSRLNQHFVKENKNRSIFRKNIGRCILNKDQSPYLPLWELDITSKAEKERNLTAACCNGGGRAKIERLYFYQTFVLVDSEALLNSPLRQAANR